MKSAPTLSSGQAPDRTAVSETVFRDLRSLLALAKGARPKDWQEAVGRHVSSLSGDYSGQTDERVALRDITFVALAAQKGSAVAKKRGLKPARWLTSPPPALFEVLENAEEARAAIKVLRPIKSEWTVGYVQRELTANKWPVLIGDLIAWQLAGSSTIEGFLQGINGTHVPSGVNSAEWIGGVIHVGVKALAKTRLPAGTGFMAEAEQLVAKAANPSTTEAPDQRRHRNAAQRALATLISSTASMDPAILVQGAAIAAIRSLGALSTPADSVAAAEFESLCRRLIAVASLLLPGANLQMIAHLKDLWTTYRELTPRAEQLLKNAMKDFKALGALAGLAPAEIGGGKPQESATLEGVITELVSNWDSYVAQHGEDPAVRQLSARIEDLIKALGIFRFGSTGEVVPFDPLRHHLPGASGTPPAKVVIRTRGIALQRPDGSSRVLLQAIVERSQGEGSRGKGAVR